MKSRHRHFFLTLLSVFFSALTLTSFCISSPMDYGSCCSFPSWDPCLLGAFEVGGELLWWKPCPGIKRVILEKGKGEQDTTYIRRSLCPPWEPGKRFWIYKPFISCGSCGPCGSCGLGASWSAICHEYSISDKVKDDNHVFSIPYYRLPVSTFSQVDTSWKISYQDYNALFSYSCYFKNFIIHPFFGFTGLALEEKVSVVAQVSDNSKISEITISSKSCLFAYGLRIGSKFECPLFRCFNAFGKASLSLLAGRPRIHSQIGGDDFKKRVLPYCYPNCHLAVGISYNPIFCYGNFSFRVGYEFIEWFHLPRSPHFLVDPNLRSTNNKTLGWQGLFAGVNVSF